MWRRLVIGGVDCFPICATIDRRRYNKEGLTGVCGAMQEEQLQPNEKRSLFARTVHTSKKVQAMDEDIKRARNGQRQDSENVVSREGAKESKKMNDQIPRGDSRRRDCWPAGNKRRS